jgi:nitroreductase
VSPEHAIGSAPESMSAMDAIFSRRSIRKFTPDPVSAEMVDELLKAAMAAPSAGDQRPWHFIVIKERDTLARIPTLHPYAAMCPEAALVMAVCADLAAERHPGYWVQDCAAATQNMLVAAQALGLGSVWLGVHPVKDREDNMRALLGLPDNVMPFALVALGYPAEHKPQAQRFDQTRIHQERW